MLLVGNTQQLIQPQSRKCHNVILLARDVSYGYWQHCFCSRQTKRTTWCLQVFGDIDAIVNPCTNLACKLDVRNCTSQTVLGLVGSVCTGRIVVANPTGKLHPIGSLLVNFPCIEHTGPLMNLAPLASNTNNGMYMPKVSCTTAYLLP